MVAAPFTILLVEDEQADALMFQEMMSEVSPDVHVHHVVNGRDALQALTRAPGHSLTPQPHLIVLDLNMPVMNGHEFLKRAKALDGVRRIPVLVLTTSTDASDIATSYDAHASGYVVKPSTYQEFMAVMQTIRSYWQGMVRLPALEDLADRLSR
ncbi:response regulator [uncultured Deinococcus sp.]|uniref:response regulator n=1 Tax=uncultured Deinococcus sp. TaxID=158789 RepID=UPI0025DC7F3D|nr:response regulator [uncultured Deinococcus sp.]